jgi:hypothetical protein
VGGQQDARALRQGIVFASTSHTVATIGGLGAFPQGPRADRPPTITVRATPISAADGAFR